MEDNIPTSKIDFIDLFIVFWKHKLFILKITLLFLSIGAIISFVLPKKYTVTIIMVPQINKSDNWGQLSSFAEMAGINLNLVNNSNILTPQVYPLIIKSIPLQVELLNSKVFIKNSKDSISIFDYYSIQARGVFEKLLPLRWSKTKSEEKQSTIQN
ncbi:MAG TPA: Wzz/FepE/Etk N-terminal domain-containing protein, partial [Bacteroidales bacterium]|nr:Wzz/FepE/Etk N-terminal domain-containing protein [Bacteroidales bacterium]